MSGDPTGEPQWVYVSTPKKRPGCVVLIVALIILVVGAVAALLVWQIVTAAGDERPVPSDSASASASPSTTPTPPPATSSSSAPPSAGPSASASAPDPTLGPEPEPGAFDDAITNRLDDALTGLDVARSLSGQDIVSQAVEPLMNDAQVMFDHAVPAEAASQWRETLSAYMASLGDLREAALSGGDTQNAIAAALTQVETLRSLAGI